MSDLIDRQAAIEIVDRYDKSHMILKGKPMLGAASIVIELEDLPSAQPEITRCKDCLHWVRTCGDNQWGLGDCDVFDKHLVMCEGFCAWAERREE